MRRLALVLLLPVLVAAACGEAADDGDAKLARSSVLTVADLGRGWRAIPADDGPTIAETCPGFGDAPAARAHSKRFVRGQAAVDSAVAVWRDAASARREFEVVVSDRTQRCVEDMIEDATREQAELDEVAVHITRAAARSWGEASVVFDTEIVEVRGDDRRTYHLAAVFVRDGRKTAQLVFGDWPRPGVPNSRLIELVLRRLGGERAA